MEAEPKICTLLFLLREGEICLAMKKRGFGANRYNGVGGKIDPGETIEQAMVRECQEEIEVTPLTWEKIAYHDFTGQNDDGTKWKMLVHAFISYAWEGEPVETEEMAPQWFNIDKIPYNNMWQDDEFWLPQVIEGKKVTGTYTFDAQDNMLTHDVREVTNFDK
jgi:8-oxo-dGTP pyrophosphatase MutT (NUDIX family)